MSRDILLLVDALAREKNVERDTVFEALEHALASAIKRRFTEDADIRVVIDRDTGEHEGFRRWLVVPDEAGLQEPDRQELYSDAQDIVQGIEVDDYIEEPLSRPSLVALVLRQLSRLFCNAFAMPSASRCSMTSSIGVKPLCRAPSSAWIRA